MQPLINLLRSSAGKAAVIAGTIIIMIFALGPMITIDGKQPLNSQASRFLVSVIVLGIAIIYTLVAGKRRDQQNAELVSAAAPSSSGGAALAANMDRAVRYLRQGKIDGKRVRLNEMPWYVMIGPPGNGKTTALRSSGLRFPLREIIANEAYAGSHGTRNCTWWLSDAAVFLDTAGRYSVPETDGVAEAAEWASFLRKLKTLRAPTPLNGILLVVGADSLLESDARIFRRMADQLAARVLEILEMCGARIPVYVVISKIDRLTGFVQVFEDDLKSLIESPMGVTFEPTGGTDPLPQARLALDWLVDRIDRHVLSKVSKERNRSVAVNMLTFPRQLQASTERAHQLLDVLARASSHTGLSPWIRGFYLISSVQEGNLINRLAQQIQADLGVSLRSDASELEPDSRTYFLPGLFRDIILKEAGISGMTAARVARSRWRDWTPHLATLGLALVLLIGLTWSYVNNRSLLSAVEERAVVADSTLRGGAWDLRAVAADVETFLALLEATGAQEPNPSLGYRWFLYQGAWAHTQATDQYRHYASKALLEPLATALKHEMTNPASPVAIRFDALKCYQMLETPKDPHFDRAFVALTAERVWARQHGQDPALEWLKRGLQRLLDMGANPIVAEREVIERTRAQLGVSVPSTLGAIVLERFKWQVERPMAGGALQGSGTATLADLLGPEGASILRSEQLGTPIPSWGRGAALRASGAVLKEQVALVIREAWVLGADAALVPRADALEQQVAQAYSTEYARMWSTLIESLELDVPGSLEGIDQFLTRVSPPAGMTSPLESALTNLANELRGGPESEGIPMERSAPTMVAKSFSGFLAFVDGTARPSLAEMAAILAEIRTQVAAYRATVADPAYAGPLGATMGLQVSDLVRQRGVAASALPSPMSRWFSPPMLAIAQDLSRGAMDQQKKAQAERAKPQCTDSYLAAYPFRRGVEKDASVGDVAAVFSPTGGVRSHIASIVKPEILATADRWTLKPNSPFTGAIPDKTLEQFRRIEYFGDRLFPDGSRVPTFSLAIEALSVPESFVRILVAVGSEEVEIFPKSGRLNWHADDQVDGSVTLVVESNFSDRQQVVFPGVWGLFRMIDAALSDAGSGNGVLMRFHFGNEQLLLRLKSRPIEELVTKVAWRTLGCPQV